MVRIDYAALDAILEKYGMGREKLVPILQEIQDEYKFLPADALKYVSGKLGMSAAQVYSIATFYDNFSLNEKGKYVIKICNGTACHVRKADDIQEALYEATGMSPDDNISADGLFTILRVTCLGACGLAPVCTVNDVVYPKMTPEKVYRLIIELREAEKA